MNPPNGLFILALLTGLWISGAHLFKGFRCACNAGINGQEHRKVWVISTQIALSAATTAAYLLVPDADRRIAFVWTAACAVNMVGLLMVRRIHQRPNHASRQPDQQ